MDSSPASTGKKRRLSLSQDVKMCSFCGMAPAAVSVDLKSTRRKAKPTAFCLQHYYTTSAVRQSAVTILNQDVVNDQLEDNIQQVFAVAFSELQQELAHESARAFSIADPLAIVGELRGKPKARPKQEEGGFIPKVPLPERLLKTQQEQARVQREQAARMTASIRNTEVNPYERRKPSRKSIWHLAMQEPTKEEAALLAADRSSEDAQKTAGVACSCGSIKVTATGHSANRNSEMTKGETWGSKDRGESLISRYQCETCGRIWNHEE